MMRPKLHPLHLCGVFAVVVLISIGALAATSQGAVKILTGSYATDALLSKPGVVGPTNGEQLAYPDDPVKLQWLAVPGATKYEVQVAQQANASVDCESAAAWQAANILFTHTTSELGWAPELTSAETGAALWTGSFCWRVRATGSGAGIWSVSNRFDMSWSAQATNLKFYSDEDGAIPRAAGTAANTTGFDTGYVEWSGVRGAANYEIQFSEAPTFGANSLFATKTYPATRMLLPQMPDNNYSWRVRPIAANGVHGAWSEAAVFTIQRDTRYWTTNPATLYPSQGGTVDDLRIGWEPVPGASYYRYMAATSSTVFPELESTGPYGTPGATCGAFLNSRLSVATVSGSSTVNNWVTAAGILDPAVVANLATYCSNDGGTPLDPLDDTFLRPAMPSPIHWRVYPVWQLSSATETGWSVTARSIVGSPVQRSFILDPYDNTAPTDPTIGMVNAGQCEGDPCLRLMGGSMSPLDSSTNSSTMQVPVFTWGAYQGVFGDGPGSFRIDVSRDSAFNNAVAPPGAPSVLRGWIGAKGPARRDAWAGDSTGMSVFGPINRSFAFTTGLPDEGLDGNGYFWRALPCESGNFTDNSHSGYVCNNVYTDATGPGQSTGIVAGTPNSGALEFAKRVRVSTDVIEDFTETTPMLMVGPVGAGSNYSLWQRGIQGADHYEFEVSKNQGFSEGTKTFKTTVPRIVPWGATPAELLEAGAWFWRVRAVDRDGLSGTWSDTSSFSVASVAPTVTAKSASAGVGATVQWSPVTGANLYQVAWSTDSGFGASDKAETRQTAYHIPSTTPGQFYWRVRTKVSDTVFGAWSVATPITIYAPSTIRYGLNRTVTGVGTIVTIDAELKVAGASVNGQRVNLQRKSTACNVDGAYRFVSAGITGKGADDGMARIRTKVAQNGCYRLAWAHPTGVITSASFLVGAKPTVSFRLTSKTVRRGKNFCSRIVANKPITGRLRVQYKVGAAWITARSTTVRAMRKRTQCMAISRAGSFTTRLVLDEMRASGGWRVYDDVIVNGPKIRVNDAFVIRR